MAEPRQLPSGQWRVQWVGADGKRHGSTHPTKSNASRALARRQTEEDEIRSKLVRPRSTLTVDEAAKDWLTTRSAGRQKDDEPMLRLHIAPYLGAHRLSEINDELVERFKRHLESKRTKGRGHRNPKPIRPKTIKNILIVLAKMLGDLGFPRRIKYKFQPASYEWIRRAEDVARFIEACKPDWFRVACAVAVYTGMRLGEVAGLRVRDVDLADGLIHVHRSYVDDPTKGRSERWVPISSELKAILAGWMTGKGSTAVLITKAGKNGPVPLPDGDSLAPDVRKVCRRLGLTEVTFHGLRHTAGSHMTNQVSMPIVGKIFGHKSPLTTAKYSHQDPLHVARLPGVHLNFGGTSDKTPVAEAGCTPGAHADKTEETKEP